MPATAHVWPVAWPAAWRATAAAATLPAAGPAAPATWVATTATSSGPALTAAAPVAARPAPPKHRRWGEDLAAARRPLRNTLRAVVPGRHGWRTAPVCAPLVLQLPLAALLPGRPSAAAGSLNNWRAARLELLH